MKRVADWVRLAADSLAANGFESAQLEAQLLAAHALGVDRTWVLAHPEANIQRADALLDRRLKGEPLAYILGYREFYGRRFSVSPAVLIPRQETEVLVEVCLSLPLPNEARVLDIGAGSGAIAITLKLEKPDWVVCATDLSADALAVASVNSRRLGAEVTFEQADLYPAEGDFDLIVSNPPYVGEGEEIGPGVEFEPPLALYAGDGYDVYRRLAATALSRLKPGGYLALELGAGQAAQVGDLLSRSGWKMERLEPDLAGIARVLVAREGKSSF